MRSRAERRFLNVTKALRKRRLHQDIGYNDGYDNLHQYSKNNIYGDHYSNVYVTKKTNNRGRRKYYGQGSKCWKASDLRKIQRFKDYMEC